MLLRQKIFFAGAAAAVVCGSVGAAVADGGLGDTLYVAATFCCAFAARVGLFGGDSPAWLMRWLSVLVVAAALTLAAGSGRGMSCVLAAVAFGLIGLAGGLSAGPPLIRREGHVQ